MSQLKTHLERLRVLRGREAVMHERLQELKRFQSERLGRTYADVAAEPRYTAATSFFLGDLYGPGDFSRRDEEMLRILPVMARILPEFAMQTATLAIELEALSEDLDQRIASALPEGPITEAAYAAAYRKASTPAERESQIDLIVEVGQHIDALVGRPLVFSTLRMMRGPARMAGLAELQDFLERGFTAFRDMKGAESFLALIRSREGEILRRLFSGAPRPFAV